jgi:hypothetical protein
MIAEIKDAPYKRDQVLRLIRDVCARFDDTNESGGRKTPPPMLDYESARQLVSFLDVAYEDLFPKKTKTGDKKVLDVLDRLKSKLGVNPYIKRDERTTVMRKIVEDDSEAGSVADSKKFAEYLKDVGNEAALNDLVKSKFLETLRHSSNKGLTEKLLEGTTINKLQDLSDAELHASLGRIADYDPKVVNADLKAISQALVKPK